MIGKGPVRLFKAIIFTMISLFIITGCFSGFDRVPNINKGIYNDIIPTVENILDLSVINKEYTIKDLNLTKDEKEAIQYYQENPITFIDLDDESDDVFVEYMGEEISISDYAYDMRLVEEFFDLNVKSRSLETSADVISALNTGDADIITEFIYTENRAEYIDFVETPSVNRPLYYYTMRTNKKDNFVDLLSLDEDDRKIGMTEKDYRYYEEFINTYGIQVTIYPNINEATVAIENGYIVGCIASKLSSEHYGTYAVDDISRYVEGKTYSVAYKNNSEHIEHIASAIRKLLDIDSRQEYYDLRMKLRISDGTYLSDIEKEAIAYYEDNPLMVEIAIDSFPDAYLDENGEWAGIAVDSFEHRAEILGLNYEIITQPDDTFEDVMSNMGFIGSEATSDAIIGVWYTDSRAEILDFVDPLIDVNFVLVGRENTKHIADLDDISKIDIGIAKYYGYKEIILDTSFSADKEYTEYETEVELIEAFARNEVDYFIVSEDSLGMYVSEYRLYDAVIKYTFSNTTYVTIGFAKSDYSEGIISAFNKVSEYDSITKYTEHYDMSHNLSKIIKLENKLATRNIIYSSVLILVVLLIGIILLFNKKRKDSRRDARTDKLTEVGNRMAFFEDCESISLSTVKILFVDLSNFKIANDTYGHDFGDLILKTTAKRLSSMSEKSTTYRLGGDEFVVTIPADDKFDIGAAIKKISTPIYDNVENNLKGSLSDGKKENSYGYVLNFACGVIDVSKFPEFNDLDTILKYVDLAMYEAKKKDKSNSSFFEVTEEFMRSFDSIDEIEKSIINGNIRDIFVPVFQPIYDIKLDKFVGFESLVRYKNNPSISPTQFLPSLKRNGRSKELDLFMIEESVKFLNDMIELGIIDNDACTSINLGTFTVAEIQINEIDTIINKYNIKRENVYLEITEESVLSPDSFKNMSKLGKIGYKLVIDDFTTDSSSLSLLNELNVDFVKFNQEILKSKTNDTEYKRKQMIIYSAAIQVTRSLGLKLISEGVETKEQLEISKQFDINIVQGNYISKPISKEEFIELVKRGNK